MKNINNINGLLFYIALPVTASPVLAQPAAGERRAALSLESAPNTPVEFAVRLKSGVAKYAQTVKQSGARGD